MVDSSKITGFGQSFQKQADILKGDEEQQTNQKAKHQGWSDAVEDQVIGPADEG